MTRLQFFLLLTVLPIHIVSCGGSGGRFLIQVSPLAPYRNSLTRPVEVLKTSSTLQGPYYKLAFIRITDQEYIDDYPFYDSAEVVKQLVQISSRIGADAVQITDVYHTPVLSGMRQVRSLSSIIAYALTVDSNKCLCEEVTEEKAKAAQWYKSHVKDSSGVKLKQFIRALDIRAAQQETAFWRIGWSHTNSRNAYQLDWVDNCFIVFEVEPSIAKEFGFSEHVDVLPYTD